jgi:hypothetical protein
MVHILDLYFAILAWFQRSFIWITVQIILFIWINKPPAIQVKFYYKVENKYAQNEAKSKNDLTVQTTWMFLCSLI